MAKSSIPIGRPCIAALPLSKCKRIPLYYIYSIGELPDKRKAQSFLLIDDDAEDIGYCIFLRVANTAVPKYGKKSLPYIIKRFDFFKSIIECKVHTIFKGLYSIRGVQISKIQFIKFLSFEVNGKNISS